MRCQEGEHAKVIYLWIWSAFTSMLNFSHINGKLLNPWSVLTSMFHSPLYDQLSDLWSALRSMATFYVCGLVSGPWSALKFIVSSQVCGQLLDLSTLRSVTNL